MGVNCLIRPWQYSLIYKYLLNIALTFLDQCVHRYICRSSSLLYLGITQCLSRLWNISHARVLNCAGVLKDTFVTCPQLQRWKNSYLCSSPYAVRLSAKALLEAAAMPQDKYVSFHRQMAAWTAVRYPLLAKYYILMLASRSNTYYSECCSSGRARRFIPHNRICHT